MAKDTFYFQHDYDARNDDKVLELRVKYGAEGYGIFWMVIETMAANENGMIRENFIGGLSLGYGVAKGWLSEFINDCISIGLFDKKDGYIFSKRLLTHKEFRKSLSEQGKEGAKKRWGGLKGGYSDPYAKERKGKEKNKGIKFNEEKNAVILEDGKIQKLGKSQMQRIRFDDLKPEDVFEGYIA